MFGTSTAYPTGLPALDAHTDFRRARRARAVARIARWVARRGWCSCPRWLRDVAAVHGGPQRLAVVPLSSIVGTFEPTAQFDERFRPASDLVRRRWERVALAHRSGAALPPVVLRHGPGGYYVVDGRHRVSVARAFGHRDIDGWVVGAG